MYENNHFKPTNICSETTNVWDIYNYNMHNERLESFWMNYIYIEEEEITCVKWKIFIWNFELDNALLKVQKRHFEWILQDIALVLFTNICI
jgi:hypothetical protein